MELVIVTGMSGAGKDSALKILEDIGYYCVDNLPVPLLPVFAELMMTQNEEITKAAVGIDIRNVKLKDIESYLKKVQENGCHYEILFMEASDATLIKRYKESRRVHPMTGDARIGKGIETERKQLAFLKKKADYIIDTSQLLIRELNQNLNHIFVEEKAFRNIVVTVLSFGFKYGIPTDADLIFDVRFLPNPYYVEELKRQTGNDKAVQDYVCNCSQAGEFLDKLTDMVQFLLPNYITEGKYRLVIGIGCTGGKHRSVTIANKLFESLEKQGEYNITIEHRDIMK